MKKTVLLKNAEAIVSCDPADRVYRGCDILIRNGFIAEIGAGLSAEGAETIDASRKFIYPGLINTHHHFFQTFVRNTLAIDYPNLTVVDWIDKIYRVFQVIDNDVIYFSTLTALSDLIKHGCTCAFDHQYCFTKKTGTGPVDRQMAAAELLGIRYHAGRGTNTLPRSEGSTIPDEMLETTDTFIADCERLIDTYHDPNPGSMRQVVIAPCQPINSYLDTFTESVRLARARNVRLHTHLGEGENGIMTQRWGKRTLDWCEEIGFIGEDVWFAHFWEGTMDEVRKLARAGSGVSHCPGPAILGGFPILDLRELVSTGVNVSLGCDGSATNDSSSLLDTMRMGYLMQAWHCKARGGCVTPYEILKLATVGGAKTLGRSDLGSLEVGKCADLFMIDTDVPELSGTLHDPKNLLSRVGRTDNVWLTMVGGKVVYQDGKLTGIDEPEIARAGEAVCDRVIRGPFRQYF